MKHRRLTLNDRSEWNAAIESVPHAFGHSWDSCRAHFLATDHPTFLFMVENESGRAVLPFAERSHQGYKDIYTPYGIAGWSGHVLKSETFKFWKDYAREEGYIAGYIGQNPLLTSKSDFPIEDVYCDHSIFALDLKTPIESLKAGLSTLRKRQLKGEDCEIITGRHEELKAAFLRLYPEFIKNREASTTYAFGEAALRTVIESENSILIGARDPEGIRSVSLFVFSPYVADFYLTASDEVGRKYSTKIMWNAIEHFHKAGIPRFNFGGGVRRFDGIHRFKESFGATEYDLFSLKQVYNRSVFEELARPCSSTGFFPPYYSKRVTDEIQPSEDSKCL